MKKRKYALFAMISFSKKPSSNHAIIFFVKDALTFGEKKIVLVLIAEAI